MDTYQQALGSLSGGKVLDVATGLGNFIEVLIENLKDYDEFVGIDCTAQPMQAFQDNLKGQNARFEIMDAADMDFLDGSFDTVCISNSLHHLKDAPAVLAEMKRVLKPGGHFIVSEMYCDGQAETQMTHVLLHHFWAAVDTARGVTHHETFTRQELVELAQRYLGAPAFYDIADLEYNPLEPELVQQLEQRLNNYLARLEGLPGEAELRSHGEALRPRIHTIGFHGATTLVAVA